MLQKKYRCVTNTNKLIKQKFNHDNKHNFYCLASTTTLEL